MEEKVMSQEDIDKALDGFFRFYEDGFEETRPAYEKIIGAFVEAKVLPEGTTLEDVIKQCKKIDAAEVVRTGGKVKESNIGLQGFFASLQEGYSEKELEDDDKAKELYKKYGIEGNLPKKAGDRLQAINMAIGEKALEALSGPGTKGDNRDQATIEAAAFLGSLAAGPYFPRQTCFSASHFMSEGSIMQIGCSQGKTSVVAMTTYEQLMAGKKVFSTSSAPGLVPENYDEAKAFYDKMGISEQFCAISQNMETKKDHIVLFHSESDGEPTKKYEITSDGKILIQVKEYNQEKGKDEKVMREVEEITQELITSLGLVSDGKGGSDFKESVRKMMTEKSIIMGDTITLGKYQDLMPERNEDGVIPDSYLIVDEADAELLDTQPQEILGTQYQGEVADNRWEDRKKAKLAIDEFKGMSQELEDYAKKVGLPLDFIVDAYEAKGFAEKDENGNPIQYSVKDGKIFVINPNTNVMIPASQGLSQAIIANDSELSEKHSEFPEMEVLGETDIPKLFSNFKVASLMSGTMQDKGMSDRASKEQKEAYTAARKVFLTRCGPGVEVSADKGVKDWKLVTPQTREEKGNVVVTLNGIKYNKNPEPEQSEVETIPEEIEGQNWREYVTGENAKELEKKWREAVQQEAARRSKAGQPVMVSVYGGRNPMDESVPVYTDKNQIGSKENGTEDHKIGDDTCMFVDDGVGEIACFDDFYGRGYTFKFIDRKKGKIDTNEKGKPKKTDKGGHVLITSLPQNSRNLEQFLFRVARGGDKGSSSIIINPTDPILTAYLERLEKEQGPEAANEYFQGVLSGRIDVMQMVVDIYPEQTQDLFYEKANQIDARIAYQAELDNSIEDIERIGKVGGRDNKDLIESYRKRFTKAMLQRNKMNRQAGVNMDTLEEQALQMRFSAIDEMIKNGEIKTVADFASILPVGLSEKYLEEIIPDENKRKQVIETIEKIQNYVDRRKTIEKQVEKKMEREEKDGENTEQRRDTINEIVEATLESEGYNLTEVKSALDVLREIKLPNRDQNREQDGVEK